MRRIPREEFVPSRLREFAYEDSPLPIEAGQTISQPYIVALMISQARIRPGDRVLEIGAGSGYAAAVMAAIALKVYAIERVPELAEGARERLDKLGYDNIELRVGDGTRGWPEAAPFDAILAAASGPEVPEVLLQQLAPGGRLVMPIGTMREHQRLTLVTRTGNGRFEQKALGDVRFVPLIGEHGWRDDAPVAMPEPSIALRAPLEDATHSIPELIRAASEPLPDFDDPAFGRMFDRFAHARVVLLGEASHGTSEFYRARDAITRRLVQAHGFRIVAVEADWPDAASIDRYVRHLPALAAPEPAFQRFPTWMWRNVEVRDFVHCGPRTSIGRRSAGPSSAASTSTASTRRSKRSWAICPRWIRKPPKRRAAAMAACRPGSPTPRATAAPCCTARRSPATRRCSIS